MLVKVAEVLLPCTNTLLAGANLTSHLHLSIAVRSKDVARGGGETQVKVQMEH